MTVVPLMRVNNYPMQTNVIPTAEPKKVYAVNQVNFGNHGGGHEGGEKNNHWFLKLLLVGIACFAGYKIFKKPVIKFIKDLKAENLTEIFKKAEKKETLTLDYVKSTMKSVAKENNGAKKGFAYRLDGAKRTASGITSQEAVAFGYKDGDNHVITHTVVCDKLDDKLQKEFNGKNYMVFS